MAWYDWLVGNDGSKVLEGMPAGLATADEQRGHLRDMLGRPAPHLDATQSNQVRGQQQHLADMLFQTAAGTRPGAGEMAVNRQAGQAQAAQVAQAQMARGAGAGLAARNAARNSAAIGVNAAGQAAQAQLADQANAQNQLNALLGATRQQDIGIAGANQNAQMAQQQIQLSALAQMLGIDQAALQYELAKKGLQVANKDQGMLPSLLQVGGQIGAAAAASDRRLKTAIIEADVDIDDTLEALRPYWYRYKDEAKHGKGPRVGVMAQDLQKTPAGREVVVDLPDGDGLGIDTHKALSLALAALARLHERLAKLEAAR